MRTVWPTLPQSPPGHEEVARACEAWSLAQEIAALSAEDDRPLPSLQETAMDRCTALWLAGLAAVAAAPGIALVLSADQGVPAGHQGAAELMRSLRKHGARPRAWLPSDDMETLAREIGAAGPLLIAMDLRGVDWGEAHTLCGLLARICPETPQVGLYEEGGEELIEAVSTALPLLSGLVLRPPIAPCLYEAARFVGGQRILEALRVRLEIDSLGPGKTRMGPPVGLPGVVLLRPGPGISAG